MTFDVTVRMWEITVGYPPQIPSGTRPAAALIEFRGGCYGISPECVTEKYMNLAESKPINKEPDQP